MANKPPKFTPFEEGKEPKKSGDHKKKKNSKSKAKAVPKKTKKQKSANNVTEAPADDNEKLIASLKAKVKKYETELRRSDDTILVQEEEIKRLSKLVKELKTKAKEGGPVEPEGSDASSDDSKKAKKRKGKKGSKPVNIKNSYPLTHINLRDGVQKDAFADLAFSVTAGGTSLSHSAIVSVRCPKFDKEIKAKYGKKKKAKRKKELEVRGFQLATVNRMLIYLYNDSLPYLSKLKPISLLHLTMIARKYNLKRLEWICENQILDVMCLDNVVELVKGADHLKDARIRKFCVDFLLLPSNYKDFVLRKDLTKELGMELFSELVTLNATQAGNPPKGNGKSGGHAIADLGECPKSEIREHLKELYKTMIYADGNVRIERENIKFHKALLAGASKPLFDCLTKARLTAGVMEDVSECLELTKDQKFFDRLSPEAMKALLKFVYYGDTNIDALPACLLIPFVREFGMKNLQELCEKIISQNVSDSHVVLKIMAVTYLAIMRAREDMRDKLRKECIMHIVTHLKEVDFLEIKNMDKEFALDLAVDLLLACQKQYC